MFASASAAMLTCMFGFACTAPPRRDNTPRNVDSAKDRVIARLRTEVRDKEQEMFLLGQCLAGVASDLEGFVVQGLVCRVSQCRILEGLDRSNIVTPCPLLAYQMAKVGWNCRSPCQLRRCFRPLPPSSACEWIYLVGTQAPFRFFSFRSFASVAISNSPHTNTLLTLPRHAQR